MTKRTAIFLTRFLPGLAPALLALGTLATAAQANPIAPDCTFNGKALYGKVQVVQNFPDLKVQVVQAFPDLKVNWVKSFPDRCGLWQKVESFPDFKIQFVQSFPDIKIKLEPNFPGLP